jgi:hypothetical protein
MLLPTSALMNTTSVDPRAAAAIEMAEARAWADMYAAAPAEFAREAGVGSREVAGTLVLSWAATGRRYFSRTIGLGVSEAATPEAIDTILEGYAEQGITMFLLQSLPHCRPAEYEGWLRQRGLGPFDSQDRVIRGGQPLEAAPNGSSDRELVVERVRRETQDEWAEFLQRVYHLHTGPWLQALIDRPGWHQYVAREEGRLAGARGMYIGPDGMAWWGMDGPVPGVMTEDWEPDAALCAFMVEDGLACGARGFIADIEAPSAAMDTPAYGYFSRLGFGRPYARTHYARV